MRWFRNRKLDDFEQEVCAHIELEAERLRQEGHSPEEAHARARRAFGNVLAANERFYEAGRIGWLDGLSRQLRLALRMLRKNPAFSATALVSLALGIGANTTMFTVVKGVALKPLPYRDSERLVWITQVLKKNSTDELTITPDFLDWRRLSRSFEFLTAFNPGERNLTGLAEPIQISAIRASAELVPALGVQPLLGRLFRREEDHRGQDSVALLTHGLWQRAFAADPHIVGRKILMDGTPYEVVGVLPPDFVFPYAEPVDLLTPLGKNEALELQRGETMSIVRNVIARLKPGVTPEAARAELLVIQAGLPKLPWNPEISIKVIPLKDHLVADAQRASWTLLGATTLLLLIACANVANLLLAQAHRRQREMAVRSALGGSRRQLIAQLLTESFVLAGLAAAAGLAIAYAARGLVLALSPRQIFGAAELPFDAAVLGFAVATAAASCLIFGLGPALRTTRMGLSEALKQGGASKTESSQSRRALAALVAAQIAVTMILVVGAGLLAGSFYRLRYTELGFATDHLVTATLKLLPQRSDSLAQGLASQRAFVNRILAGLQSIPGVEAAAVTEAGGLPPGGGRATNTFWIENAAIPPNGERPVAHRQPVSPAFFTLLGIPLKQGRLFGPEDGPNAPQVAIVNEALARRVFGSESPLGRTIIDPDFVEPRKTQIVGVVGDVKTSGLETAPEPTIFYPHEQNVELGRPGLIVRTGIDPVFIAAQLRQRLAEIEPTQPVTEIQTMDQRLTESVARPRFVAALLTGFSLLALTLGMIGIYGVMACYLRWRTKEMAIRQALGAKPAEMQRLLFAQGAVIIASGILAGLAGSVAVTRVLESFLYETTAQDPGTYLFAVVLIAASALLACWGPARRAAQVDAAAVLRAE